MPYASFAPFENTIWKRRGPDYDSLKGALAERLRHELELAVPAIAGKIDHAELSTPLTTRHFMNYQQGEGLRLGGYPGTIPRAFAHSAHLHPEPLSDRTGRRLARSHRSDDGRRHRRLRRARPQPGIQNNQIAITNRKSTRLHRRS